MKSLLVLGAVLLAGACAPIHRDVIYAPAAPPVVYAPPPPVYIVPSYRYYAPPPPPYFGGMGHRWVHPHRRW